MSIKEVIDGMISNEKLNDKKKKKKNIHVTNPKQSVKGFIVNPKFLGLRFGVVVSSDIKNYCVLQ